jgi:hypothetical protein
MRQTAKFAEAFLLMFCSVPTLVLNVPEPLIGGELRQSRRSVDDAWPEPGRGSVECPCNCRNELGAGP